VKPKISRTNDCELERKKKRHIKTYVRRDVDVENTRCIKVNRMKAAR